MLEKSNTKMIYNTLIVFGLMILAMIVVQFNYVFADSENVFYIADLKNGDIIPFDAILYTGQDYHFYSRNTGYLPSMSLAYADNGSGYRYMTLQNNSRYQVLTAKDVYKDYLNDYDIDEFVAWEVDVDENKITLYPVRKVDMDFTMPSKDNEYLIDTEFYEDRGSVSDYSWYKYIDIKNPKMSSKIQWKKNDIEEYYVIDEGIYENGDTAVLTFTFDAKKGDKVIFDARVWTGYNIKYVNDFEVMFNGQPVEVPYGRECYNNWSCIQDYSLYETHILKVKSTGKQTLTFTYKVDKFNKESIKSMTNYWGSESDQEKLYAYVKNVRLLTPLNEGEKLNTNYLDNNDDVIYIATYDDRDIIVSKPIKYLVENNTEDKAACYECDGELVWTNKPSSSCKKSNSITTQGMCVSNPKTGISKYFIISMIVISFMVLGFVLYRRYNRFERI